MLGTSPSGKGGIATVLEQYRSGGLFASGRIRFFATHNNNSRTGRWLPFLRCLLAMLPALIAGNIAIVHAHTSYGGSFWRKLLLAIPAFIFRVPVIVHLHGSKFMGSLTPLDQHGVDIGFGCSSEIAFVSSHCPKNGSSGF